MTEPTAQPTGSQLKAIRKRVKLSQAEMAEVLGISLRAYSDVEGGRSTVRPSHIRAAEHYELEQLVERRLASLPAADAGHIGFVLQRILAHRDGIAQAQRSIEMLDEGVITMWEKDRDGRQVDISAQARDRAADTIAALEEANRILSRTLPPEILAELVARPLEAG